MPPAVLFVDDDDANLIVWETACADEFEVVCANGAPRALEILREHAVAVIIADQRMPEMTGVELLEKVRTEFPDTIRILITAYADLTAAIQAINRGQVRRYLRKPCPLEELKAEIRDALDLYSLRARAAAMERSLMMTGRVYSLGLVARSLGRELSVPVQRAEQGVSRARTGVRDLTERLDVTTDIARLRAKLYELDEWLRFADEGLSRALAMAQSLELPVRDGSAERADLAEVVRHSLRLVRGELRRGGEIQLDIHPVPHVKGDPHKLGQIVLNLLANALEAVAERPAADSLVVLRLEQRGGRVVLEVMDNGPSMREENLRGAFLLHAFTDGRGATAGLGVAKILVTEMGGTLEAENRDEGGVRLRLTLPVLDRAATIAPQP